MEGSNLKEKLSQLETPQIIIGVFVLLSVGILCYGLFSGREEEETPQNVNLELPKDQKEVSNYENKLDAYKSTEQEKQNSLTLDFERGLFGEETKDSTQYAEAEDPKVKELQRQIELMEAQNEGRSNMQAQQPRQTTPQQMSSTRIAPVKSKEQTDLEYRQMLLEARNQRMQRSQDYSAEQVSTVATSSNKSDDSAIEFRAAIYRDQFILPGDRVTMILTQPLTYKGNLFPRNTFLYAVANISRSRVLLNITNINHIPVNLEAKDIRDGSIGLYNKRAGELWRDYQTDAQSNTVNEATQDLSRDVNIPLAGSAIKAFSNFFRKKRYNDSDKILLINNDELILTTKQ